MNKARVKEADGRLVVKGRSKCLTMVAGETVTAQKVERGSPN